MKKRPAKPAAIAVMRKRFIDQIEADYEAGDFLTKGLKQCTERPIELKWWNLEGDDGRMGVVTSGGKIVANVTIIRDQMNESIVAGTIFG